MFCILIRTNYGHFFSLFIPFPFSVLSHAILSAQLSVSVWLLSCLSHINFHYLLHITADGQTHYQPFQTAHNSATGDETFDIEKNNNAAITEIDKILNVSILKYLCSVKTVTMEIWSPRQKNTRQMSLSSIPSENSSMSKIMKIFKLIIETFWIKCKRKHFLRAEFVYCDTVFLSH